MPKSKKISISLIVITTILLTIVVFLGIGMFVKVYSTSGIKPEIVEKVDSLNLIRQKDSIIKVLTIDNSRLKKIVDDKPDTVFIPKPVYIKVKSDSTQH